MPKLEITNCINVSCPWSGKPVRDDSLTEYGGYVVGFCNTGCRDKFESAVHHFEKAKARAAVRADGSLAGRSEVSEIATR